MYMRSRRIKNRKTNKKVTRINKNKNKKKTQDNLSKTN